MSEIDFGSDDSLMDPNFVLPSSSGRKLKIIEDSNPEIAKKKRVQHQTRAGSIFSDLQDVST